MEGVQCRVCGKFFKALGWKHLKRHGLTAYTYKELFGINKTAGLLSDETRKNFQERALKNGNLREYYGSNYFSHHPNTPGCFTKRAEARKKQSAINKELNLIGFPLAKIDYTKVGRVASERMKKIWAIRREQGISGRLGCEAKGKQK